MSARPFVAAAAKAGYLVDAIDAFADAQTVALAKMTMVVTCDNNGFNEESLLGLIGTLEASQYLGFVYGSGFEAQPMLLQKIADIIPLIGNAAAQVLAIKTASSFFSTLSLHNIPHPTSCERLPQPDSRVERYLQKFTGGSGGTHIKVANDGETLGFNHYFQQYMIGRSISLLFLANSLEIKRVGFNELRLNPTSNLPFRYGGAVSNIELSFEVKQQMIHAAKTLTRQFGLLGLNSLDAIVKDEIVYVLEVNPRLSATVDLYSDDLYQDINAKSIAYSNIMHLHILACLKGAEFQMTNVEEFSLLANSKVVKQSTAHAVIYALEDTPLLASFKWPNWAVDTPYFDEINNVHPDKLMVVLANEPICTVLAHAEDANRAKVIVDARVESIQQILKS
ncbi:ATP-grasp domain-containing protein [Methylotenera sp.]|uniref:ATP-grasp domain-containing protein n=1 Tax=Methylotenera sp. TaxID=2051956 RepID=UPI002488A938|nr:ATP-grasp domain-containing protein [Methylotenera sp.]MDI1300065.1 ATP-grasp domain-containing protein [Methylotenera sp.]